MNPLGKPSLSSVLRAFWTEHAQGTDPLVLLQRYADVRPVLTPVRSPHAVRREHNRQRLTARWRRRLCFVCSELATQEHHIVQIKHGGTNRRDNKVWICTPCHRRVHPHLAEPPKDAPVGIVPYMRDTEQLGTCPACRAAVLIVQPAFRKTRYPMAQSKRLILLRRDATSPYYTTDLHQPVCQQKSALNRLIAADMRVMAKRDVRWAESHG